MILDAFTSPPGDIECDVCIIGSGPGGSAAARTLARAGRNVVLLEAGSQHHHSTFRNDSSKASKELYFNHGKRITDGNVNLAFLVGRGLGGGTLVNSGISFRPPRHAIERWNEISALKQTTYEGLLPYMREAEDTLKVEVISLERLGRNNQVFAEGVSRLGWSGSVIPRNTLGCMPCARCFFGCPIGAKQSTDKNFIPQAIEAGAQIFTHAHARKFRVEGGRLLAAQVERVNPEGWEPIGSFEVRAKHFILGAGAIGTARLLMSNRLANSSGQVGKNFRCHPTSGVVGLFDEKIEGFKSIMQGYFCDEFFDEEILLETVWAPAEAVATIVPGIGEEYGERLSKFNHFAMVGGMIREEGAGELQLTKEGWIKVKHHLTDRDMRKLTRSLYLSAEGMLAAGAKEVYSDNPIAPVINSFAQLNSLKERHPNLGSTIVLEGNHAQGTCRMDNRPQKGVVDEFGRSHDIRNLWLMDSSVMPDALGVNPQITITSLALRNSEYLDQNFD